MLSGASSSQVTEEFRAASSSATSAMNLLTNVDVKRFRPFVPSSKRSRVCLDSAISAGSIGMRSKVFAHSAPCSFISPLRMLCARRRSSRRSLSRLGESSSCSIDMMVLRSFASRFMESASRIASVVVASFTPDACAGAGGVSCMRNDDGAAPAVVASMQAQAKPKNEDEVTAV